MSRGRGERREFRVAGRLGALLCAAFEDLTVEDRPGERRARLTPVRVRPTRARAGRHGDRSSAAPHSRRRVVPPVDPAPGWAPVGTVADERPGAGPGRL